METRDAKEKRRHAQGGKARVVGIKGRSKLSKGELITLRRH
jgi:hypothetical protein